MTTPTAPTRLAFGFIGIFIWMFFLISSVLGLAFGGLEIMKPALQGPDASFAGAGAIVIFEILGISAIIFALCLCKRPSREAFTPKAIRFCLLIYLAFFGAAYSATHLVGRYDLAVRFVDSSNQPVADAPIFYSSSPAGDGLGRFDNVVQGTSWTDSNGLFEIRLNRAHTLSLRVEKSEFEPSGFVMEAIYRGGQHSLQTGKSEIFPPINATKKKLPEGSSGVKIWQIPPSSSVTFTSILKAKSPAGK